MKFQLPVLAVKDVKKSIKFYKELFNQEVALDLGRNITFSGGFAIQEDFGWLTGVDPREVLHKSNNMELYFEVDNFNRFIEKLDGFKDIEFVHSPKKHEWHQRVVRLYDPDYHMIEVGESMKTVIHDFASKGYAPDKISELVQSPLDYVNKILESK